MFALSKHILKLSLVYIQLSFIGYVVIFKLHVLCVYYVSILCDSQKQTNKKDLFYVCRNAFIYIGLLDKYILKN